MKGLKEKRVKLNLTQTEVSKALGLKTNTLCQYESGCREPSFETLKKMARYFKCKIDDLM